MTLKPHQNLILLKGSHKYIPNNLGPIQKSQLYIKTCLSHKLHIVQCYCVTRWDSQYRAKEGIEMFPSWPKCELDVKFELKEPNLGSLALSLIN